MKKTQNGIISTILFLTFLLPFSCAAADEITVATANSVCAVLKKAGDIFSREQKIKVRYICKSSGILAKGLETGYISADYYISASQKWMNYLVTRKIISKEAVKPLWANRIVAAAAKHSAVQMQSWNDLTNPKIQTIMVGDPSTTPLGRQFKKAMQARGLWSQIRTKIVVKRHISLTQEALLTANDTTIGILFPSNLGVELKTLIVMPEEWHDPIRYYGCPLIGNKNKEMINRFNTFLKSDVANKIFIQKSYLIIQ